MMKDWVVPDPQEIIQADPLGGRSIAVPVKKAVVCSLDNRPGDKESEDQESWGQKEEAGFHLARTPKVSQPPPAVHVGRFCWFGLACLGGSRQFLSLGVASHRGTLFNAGGRRIKGGSHGGDYRGSLKPFWACRARLRIKIPVPALTSYGMAHGVSKQLHVPGCFVVLISSRPKIGLILVRALDG
jgi:hypothetical protein